MFGSRHLKPYRVRIILQMISQQNESLRAHVSRIQHAYCWLLVALVTMWMGTLPLLSQTNATMASVDGHALPDEPGTLQEAQSDAASALSGTLLDGNGGTIRGASVVVENATTHESHIATSDATGFFRVPALIAGTYSITITAEGFRQWQESAMTMHAGEDLALPPILMSITSATTNVRVVYSPHEVAHEQVKAEETQRLLGIVPNFYTSYVWDAEPLTGGQKLQLAGRSLVDPFAFVGTGIAAAVEQDRNTYPGFGQGAQGYGSRYGALFGDQVVGVMLARGFLPMLLHQDPRYFYKGTGTRKERAEYAITRAVVQRGDNGRWQPAYSNILGSFAAGAIGNQFLTQRDRNAGTVTISNGFLGIAFDAADSLLREFVWKAITTGSAAHARP